MRSQSGYLVRLGAVEAPGADAAGGFRFVHDELEAVAEIEGHVALRKRLEIAGLASLVGATEAVLEKDRADALALVSRVDAEQAQVPVGFRRRPLVCRPDGGEECVESRQRHLGGEIVEAGGGESLRCLGGFTGARPGRDRSESGEVVDLAEEAVVANERLEHHGRQPHPLPLVRVQIDG